MSSEVSHYTLFRDGPPPHAIDGAEVLRRLEVDPAQGLPAAEVGRRRARWGPNQLESGGGAGPLILLARQFANVMIVVLLLAATVAGLIGELLDAIAILVIVVLNAIIGFVQEYRAERALEALQQLSAPHVSALRDNRRQEVAEADLVPGDIVLLEAGDVVPADLRIVETADLSVDEAALTGESVPVIKDASVVVAVEAALGDRATMAHKGTHVTAGRARCVAVATGTETELGRIASLMREGARPLTPLQRRLATFGRWLSLAVLVICAVVLFAGLARGEPLLLMFLTAVSLAVAAIPEALPAVVTIALALGAKRMVAAKALIRRLPAVETLGSVTVICCDKTGTLTQNSMRAEVFLAPTERLTELPEAGQEETRWQALGRAMALNSDVEADATGDAQGDPTEIAILEAAAAAGYDRQTLETIWPRVGEVAFEARRRRMTTLHRGATAGLAIVKGAPEAVLPLCLGQQGPEGAEPLDADGMLEIAEATARAGYRVLAFAERELSELPSRPEAADMERELTFLGLVALADPPRPRVREAIASCARAGIRVAMITGDHPATATAIAVELGIVEDGEAMLTGPELQTLSPTDLAQAVADCRVYARISPELKYDLVTALQGRGQFVAMTGDGVNDAPALKQADIGVAMGLKGTDVAREAADAVLLDDDFATVVAAVREGRRIYDNIRKFIKYTMASNAGEIWT
ncbi:MAG: HAD-IC family P-type ATPase, partial [Alphaproteobacteria bacterium]|nr:HAD-IC family P-type ATPase [Alphaproteobacteria bacterium]